MYVQGGGSGIAATYSAYHHVEFRNITFAGPGSTFDFWVDGVPVDLAVPFQNATDSFTHLYISVGWWSVSAYIDRIEVRYPEP